MKKFLTALAFILLASAASAQQPAQLNPAQPEFILNANATAAPQTGTAWATPGTTTMLTWIVSFASAPASHSTILECSNDNVTYVVCDTSTNVNGETRTVFTAARYVRATESARSGGGAITVTVIGKTSVNTFVSSGGISATGSVSGANLTAGLSGWIAWASGAVLRSLTDGFFSIRNAGESIGSLIKVDALPTIASGFGTSPSITAGSTPFAGSVNVGTGGVAASGVINFGGTAFPVAPFCSITMSPGHTFPATYTASTTQLTVSSGAAWVSGGVVSWICVSSK